MKSNQLYIALKILETIPNITLNIYVFMHNPFPADDI